MPCNYRPCYLCICMLVTVNDATVVKIMIPLCTYYGLDIFVIKKLGNGDRP